MPNDVRRIAIVRSGNFSLGVTLLAELVRRAAEKLIESGEVLVNGKPAELGTKITPGTDHVVVSGQPVRAKRPARVTLAVNKPRGVVSTMSDPQGRPSLGDFVEGRRTRLFHVGRLDADTEESCRVEPAERGHVARLHADLFLEFPSDAFFGQGAQGSPLMAPLEDTMWDLIVDGLGGLIGGLLGAWYMRVSRRSAARWKSFMALVS